jgi:predicted RNase H-like nuclease (RuvC/YqgF family)
MYTAKQEVTRTQQQLKATKNTVTELEDSTTVLRAKLVKTEKLLANASKEAELAQLNERVEELIKSNDTLKQELLAIEALEKSRNAARQSATSKIGKDGSPKSLNSNPAVQPASIGAETTIAAISVNDGIIAFEAVEELGLTVGEEITLVQGWKALGKARVTKVTEQLAVANILPGALVRNIAKGDTVKIMH